VGTGLTREQQAATAARPEHGGQRDAQSNVGQSEASDERGVEEFIVWLEGRMGRSLAPWERGKVMEWLNRILVEILHR
jgi:hypothetical protein